MKDEHSPSNNYIDLGPLAMALIVAALILGGVWWFHGSAPTTINTSPNIVQHTISVNAQAQTEVAPDKAELVFSVVNRGTDPTSLQNDNNVAVQKIIDDIKAKGVPEGNIRTISYSLQRWTEWDPKTQTSVDKGYVLTNTVRVVTYNVNQAGALLGIAVQDGANDVQDINFGLSDALQQKTYNTLLAQASAQAGDKAQSMASAAKVSISRLDSLNEGYGYVNPISNYNYRDVAMAAGASAPAPAVVSPGMAQLSATVSAVYEVN